MSFKTILKIILGISIFVFVVISLNWRSKEKEVMIEHSTKTKVSTEIVDVNTQRMMNANSQSENVLPSGDTSPTGNTSYVPPRPSSSTNTIASLIIKGTYTIKKETSFGCKEVSLLEDMIKYSSLPDKRKLEKSLNKGISNGDCISLETGDKVILEELAAGKTIARVRKAGESELWWISIETIK
jgi:hypothetical protein